MNVPAPKIDPMQDFQQKLQQRVREDIRDLLPEDAVAALVQKAVETEFFKTRRVDEGYGRTKEYPSWFVETVAKAAEPILRAHVEEYVKNNHTVITKAIDEFLNHNQMALLATSQLTNMLSGALFTLQERLNVR